MALRKRLWKGKTNKAGEKFGGEPIIPRISSPAVEKTLARHKSFFALPPENTLTAPVKAPHQPLVQHAK